MKGLFQGLFFLAIGLCVFWFALSQEADRFRICRDLGHGVVYCALAQ